MGDSNKVELPGVTKTAVPASLTTDATNLKAWLPVVSVLLAEHIQSRSADSPVAMASVIASSDTAPLVVAVPSSPVTSAGPLPVPPPPEVVLEIKEAFRGRVKKDSKSIERNNFIVPFLPDHNFYGA